MPMIKTSIAFHQNLDVGLRQSPGIEIVGEGGCIPSILPPSPTTQSRELSRNSNVKILMKRYTTSSEETEAAGARFAASLRGNETIAFFGDLGAGKTTFLKGMISALTGCSTAEITSPTFNYLHIYEGKIAVYHFDLYRLTSAEQFNTAGFSEYLNARGVCCLEWAEKIESKLPPETIRITLEHQGLDNRLITIS